MLRLPETAEGIVVSGGQMANIVAQAAMRAASARRLGILTHLTPVAPEYLS